MKIFCFFLLLAEVNTPLSPTEPSVSSPETPHVVWPEVELKRWDLPTNSPQESHLFRVTVTLYGTTNRYEGLWKLTRSPLIVLTNTTTHTLQIQTLSLYDVSQIDILSWRIRSISNTWHEFIPHEVRCISWNGKTNQGFGELSWLWKFSLERENGTWTGYTLFYDSWEKGAGERFRWKHAQFPHFPYHFTTPVPGTVIGIQFLYP
ncbi:MAG: hypothetical protein N2314_04880 [Brevinematales bacterium]|nr:hypothetical protein [Brevinematales bacterium]